jgi:pimeloyl-ACP methyl ester carboxylesterase
MRRTGPEGAPAVLCLNGGVKRALPGDWSSSVDWLVRRLAPALPGVAFYEVRYRVRSWTRLEMCIEDARAALAAIAPAGGRPVALLGYSMGGAVSLAVADDPAVTTFVGLAPWLPEELGVGGMAGRRVAVIHGAIDGRPFGVSPRESHRAVVRMRARGIEASYHVIRGALHAIALPAPGGGSIPLPRAREWQRLTAAEVDRFQAAA